jgi:ABC-2 type transport system ATP-binding protein
MKIELRDVKKRFGRIRALDGVSLELAPGQIISLLGPNGAGKTTLLRCLAGIVGPDKGEVLFDGQPFRRDRLDLRRRFLFLPEIPFLFWDATVLRNIGIALRLYEQDQPDVEDRVFELLRDFDLLPLADRVVLTLSRGQVFKAGLVALLAVDPEVWLLDEPMASGMDPHGLSAFRKHARDAAGRGRTILYSTQILDVAERFSDRVCVIHQGAIRAFDTLANLRERATDKANVLDELFRSLRDPA